MKAGLARGFYGKHKMFDASLKDAQWYLLNKDLAKAPMAYLDDRQILIAPMDYKFRDDKLSPIYGNLAAINLQTEQVTPLKVDVSLNPTMEAHFGDRIGSPVIAGNHIYFIATVDMASDDGENLATDAKYNRLPVKLFKAALP